MPTHAMGRRDERPHGSPGLVPPVQTEPVHIEPITPAAPQVRLATMRQDWSDVIFLHWEVAPDDAAQYLPDDLEPDLLAGRTYVGLIGLGIRVALLDAVRVPYFGVFPEINVRLYSVDRHGRRGIVFRSLDAGRLAPTAVARGAYRLPYMWWAGERTRMQNKVTYAGRRLWPAGGPKTRFAVRVGEPLSEPSELDHFLTARWTLHWSWLGRTVWCPAADEPWPLHKAELVECADELVTAAGLPAPIGPPASVLFAPGVSARIGVPRPVLPTS